MPFLLFRPSPVGVCAKKKTAELVAEPLESFGEKWRIQGMRRLNVMEEVGLAAGLCLP